MTTERGPMEEAIEAMEEACRNLNDSAIEYEAAELPDSAEQDRKVIERLRSAAAALRKAVSEKEPR